MTRNPYLAVFLCLASTTTAQVDWSQVSTASTPNARTKHTFAFDPLSQSVLLFGGRDANGGTLSETWSFDGTTWTQRTPSTSPPGRWQHAMVTDIQRARIVMFSGYDGNSAYWADTWEWNGATWTQMQPTTQPPARDHHAMAYDPLRGRTVLFGGWDYFSGRVLYNDTWEWDGSNWARVTTAATPSGRDGHAMCFDLQRRNVVMFGGGRESPSRLGDTWTYDGTNWTPQNPQNSPPARVNHRMTYDYLRDVVVLFGGYDGPNSGSGIYYGDTWEWDGTDWTQRTPATTAPSARSYMPIAYDTTRSTVFGFGGDAAGTRFPETWVYGPTHVAVHSAFGSGCSGSAGILALDGTRPWLGSTYTTTLRQLAPSAIPFVAMGFSNSTSPLGSLPLDLGPFGAPGCSLLVDPVAPSPPLANQNGVATLDLPIPVVQSLLGAKVYSQGIALEQGANVLGAVFSNGGDATLGGR